MVGQEQDGQPWGGFFDLDQGFTGKISQVELWDTALTSSEISLIADCKQASVRPNNRLVTWDSNAWIAVKSEFEDEPLESFCTRNPIANTFFWPNKIPYIKMSRLCKINNARMPTIKSKSETRSSHDFYTKKFIALNETHPGNDKCLLSETASKFWYGLKYNPKTQIWYDPEDQFEDYSSLKEVPKNPPDICLHALEGEKLVTRSCTNSFPCGICEVSDDQLVYLKGLCKTDISSLYDFQYYVHGIHNGKPHFRYLLTLCMEFFIVIYNHNTNI